MASTATSRGPTYLRACSAEYDNDRACQYIDVQHHKEDERANSRMQSQQSEVESNVENQVENTEGKVILCNYQALKVNVCIST